MASSLSNLVNNLSEGIHRIKFKSGHEDKMCETCGIIYKYCDCVLEYTSVKDDLIEYKWFCCNKNHQQNFDEKLKERFFNTYKFSNHDGWLGKIQWKSLPEKEDFYSLLNMEDITDAEYPHAKRISKDFEIKESGEYQEFYVQSDT